MKLNFLSLLTLIFITLKLTSVIAWSWWWVLSPLWIPMAIALPIMIIVAIISPSSVSEAFKKK